MSKILIIAEHLNNQLNASTAKTIRCAQDLNASEIDVLVIAKDVQTIAEQAQKLAGVTQVLTLANPACEHAMASIYAPLIATVAKDYSHVLAPSTTFGKDVMPRVAALLGEAQITDIMKVIDTHTFERPIYAGNAIVTIQCPQDRKVIATVRTASYPAVANADVAAPMQSLNVDVKLPSHTRFVELKAGSTDRPDLQSASRVISGGRALGSAENFEIIYRLANKLNAGVGASRAAVDAGYAPNDMQVGQTGKIIAPDLYMAFGISGAIQHITGIKDAGTIVAINKDGEAPIFEVADIGLVGDLFQIIPELEQAL